MKRLLIISLCLLTVFSLSGGSGAESRTPIKGDSKTYRFQTIKKYKDGWTMYDKENGNMYFVYTVYRNRANSSTDSGIIDLHQQYEGWNE